jgi:hypothetical protein
MFLQAEANLVLKEDEIASLERQQRESLKKQEEERLDKDAQQHMANVKLQRDLKKV